MSRSTVQPETITIGPADHGRAISLAGFEFAVVKEGHRCELSRGIITVSDVPDLPHAFAVQDIRDQVTVYKLAFPGVITFMGGGSDCKLLVDELESERHPNLALYLTAPPGNGREVWRRWIPAIVIEVVSPSSEQRDDQEKREEYLALGIKEYWIIDLDARTMLALRRHGKQWRQKSLGETDVYETRVLPSFKLDLARVFVAANQL